MPITVYDNNSVTVDQYSVVIDKEVFGMSENPLSPNGFNQYSGRLGRDLPIDTFEHCKTVELIDLPKQVILAILYRFEESYTDPI